MSCRERVLPGDLLEVDYEDGSEPLILDLNNDFIYNHPMDSEYQEPENPHPELMELDFESSTDYLYITLNANLLPMRATVHGRYPAERATPRLEHQDKFCFLLQAWIRSLDRLIEPGDSALWPYEMQQSFLRCLVVTLLEHNEILVQHARVLGQAHGDAANDVVEAAEQLHERQARMIVDRGFNYRQERRGLRWKIRFALEETQAE